MSKDHVQRVHGTLIGQVKKGIRRMPWHWEPKKDVTSCDKLRAGANIRLSADFRMRELT